MTAAEQKTLDILVKLVDRNAAINDEAHKEIKETIAQTFDRFQNHCALREVNVNKALEDLANRPTKMEMGARTIGKFFAVVLANTAIIVGVIKAFGLF